MMEWFMCTLRYVLNMWEISYHKCHPPGFVLHNPDILYMFAFVDGHVHPVTVRQSIVGPQYLPREPWTVVDISNHCVDQRVSR
jgi:hypothetical protein